MCTRTPTPAHVLTHLRGIVHVFAGHVNTDHPRDGPHLGAQPLSVRVGNERSHAARWLIQRDMAPEWGAWCRIELGREGVLCHNFSRSSLQPILGGGLLTPSSVWLPIAAMLVALTSAPLWPRPIGFSILFITDFLASIFPTQHISIYPDTDLNWKLRTCVLSALPQSPPFGGWLPSPSRDYGDRATSHDQADDDGG